MLYRLILHTLRGDSPLHLLQLSWLLVSKSLSFSHINLSLSVSVFLKNLVLFLTIMHFCFHCIFSESSELMYFGKRLICKSHSTSSHFLSPGRGVVQFMNKASVCRMQKELLQRIGTTTQPPKMGKEEAQIILSLYPRGL